MKVTFKSGRVLDLDDEYYLNPEETFEDDIWALSIPFGNFSMTFVIRAKEHEVVSVLLDSKFGDRIKVAADDLATATDDFLIDKGYSKEQIALFKEKDELNNLIRMYDNEEYSGDSLHDYFENRCDFAFDGDINTWYHSDLLMADCLEKVTVTEYTYAEEEA